MVCMLSVWLALSKTYLYNLSVTDGLLLVQVNMFRILIRREILHQSSLQHPFTVALKEASHFCLYIILHTLQHPFCAGIYPCADVWRLEEGGRRGCTVYQPDNALCDHV